MGDYHKVGNTPTIAEGVGGALSFDEVRVFLQRAEQLGASRRDAVSLDHRRSVLHQRGVVGAGVGSESPEFLATSSLEGGTGVHPGHAPVVVLGVPRLLGSFLRARDVIVQQWWYWWCWG